MLSDCPNLRDIESICQHEQFECQFSVVGAQRVAVEIAQHAENYNVFFFWISMNDANGGWEESV